MHMQLEYLRERLLREGVASRHVRRYLAELSDHFDDALAEEQARGVSGDAAAHAAWSRIGNPEELAMSALSRPELRSVYVRFSPAIFGAGPIVTWFAIAYATLASLIATRWFIGSLSPSVVNALQSVCFAYVRMLPVAIGIAMLALAHKHRVAMTWPVIGAVLIAVWAGTSELFIVPGSPGHLNELEFGNALLSLVMADSIGVPESPWLRPSFGLALLNVMLILSPLALWRRARAVA